MNGRPPSFNDENLKKIAVTVPVALLFTKTGAKLAARCIIVLEVRDGEVGNFMMAAALRTLPPYFSGFGCWRRLEGGGAIPLPVEFSLSLILRGRKVVYFSRLCEIEIFFRSIDLLPQVLCWTIRGVSWKNLG
jgi:hypothetical protein